MHGWYLGIILFTIWIAFGVKNYMDTEISGLSLTYGYNQAIPKDVGGVWGARLIWPNDLLWDRQSIARHEDQASDEELERLTGWLNSIAVKEMREKLSDPWKLGLHPNEDMEAIIYEDEIGKIIGNTLGSHGYVYVVAYLK